MARDFRRLLDQVASLTAERDSLKPPYESAILAAVRETIWAERGLLAEVRAERDAALARLEKARGLVLEFAANMGPGFFDSYPTLVKLRAALTGTSETLWRDFIKIALEHLTDDAPIYLDQVVVPELLTPMEEPEGIEEDSYRGSSGWVVVFGGEGGGRSVYAEVGPGFGALRWWINESGLDDPDDADLGAPDEGFWRVHARAHAGRCHETGVQDDLYFSRESEWEAVERDPSAETGWVKAGDSSHAALAQQLADLRADRDARLAAALKAWQRYRDYRDDPSTRAEAASDLTNILNGRGRCRAPGGGA